MANIRISCKWYVNFYFKLDKCKQLSYFKKDEQSFYKASPLIRSLLASLIIQWDSFQEQSTRNTPKTLAITVRLLNIINRVIILAIFEI